MIVALCASRAESQTFTTLVNFTGSSGTATGSRPYGSLTLSGTTLYGMTQTSVFSVGTNGTGFQNLTAISGDPWGSLIIGGSTLYGMTQSGGANGLGNVFCVGANGTNYQNLLSFTGGSGAASGAAPLGSLTLSGTTLYGMKSELVPLNPVYYGNVFSVGTGGTNYQNLATFAAGPGIGNSPYGSLTLSGTTLYGMTWLSGSIFSVGTDGTSLHSLVSVGAHGSLTLSGTTLYGMTSGGGTNGDGTVFSVGINGTNYQSLLSFTGTSGAASGNQPRGSLILSGTTLYGMTSSGGANGLGNIFSVGINGLGYVDIYSFSGPDGDLPYGDLTISGGTLFGMTQVGGQGLGNVFALTLPTPTPEPATLALVGTGAAALVSYRWRRKRRR
jgi:uncharacterized repeat protein (TIGR03803 family)